MASNQTAIEESLRSLLNCNICKQEVDELKVLPCQHTVCLPCAKQLNVVKRKFTCSICKKEHPMPNGGVGNLPDSLVGKQLKDLVKSEQLPDINGKSDNETSEVQQVEDKEASCKPEKGGKEKGDAIVKSTSSNVTKILAGGGFGSVPVEGSRGDATKTSKSKATQNMSVKIKEKPQSQAQSNKVDAKTAQNLVKEMKEELETASSWFVEACHRMGWYKESLDNMRSHATSVKKVYQDHQKTLKKPFSAKLKDLDSALTERTEDSTATLSVLKPCVAKLENVIESLPKSIISSWRLRWRDVPPEEIRETKANFEELEAMNKEVEAIPIDLDYSKYIKEGDYVRLTTLEEAESMLGYYHGRKVSSDTRIENILNSKVTHTSVGRYLRETYSGNNRIVMAVFPEQIDWKGPAGSLVKCQKKVSLPYIGDKVKIKPSVTKPHFSWNGIRQKRCKGTLKEIKSEGPANDLIVIVNFPENHDWKGLYSEIELAPSCGLEVGDEVRVNSNIPEPSRGWAEVNGSSIGKITAIEGPEGQEEVTVDFPECKDWVGLATELEMSREPIKGEKVQVKLTVKTPKLGWGGATHEDIGELVEIVESSRGSGRVGNVKFAGKPERPFQIEDLELARYQAPSYDESSQVNPLWQMMQLMNPAFGLFGAQNFYYDSDDCYDDDYDYYDCETDYDYDS